ncbi:hypothetical protein [Oligoflexus tunisiensis]|uniref:hypothetical protein n=1 Tax=Oligoflexus tunisiensis TaxID=708132 RepID=UPI00114CDE53|nr:hypothetical protein [Oligoflexus tunisiensis]
MTEAKQAKIIITRSADDVIDEACSRITALIKEYRIASEEWPIMEKESPGIWKRIQELEWLGPQSFEETERGCEALVLNHELMFKRKVLRRTASHAA